ncbi:MAG: MATE family efflux transporter, partial [Cytophagales bacterium]
MLVGIADTIIAGNLGNIPLASATLASSIFYPVLMLGIGISYGQTSMVSQYHGMGLVFGLKKIFGRMMVVNIILGFILPILMILSFPFLSFTQQPQEVVEACHSYYVILAFSMFPIMIFQSFKQFAEGISITKVTTYISLGANLLNVVLNVVLIEFYGLVGIAMATLISRLLMAISIMFWFNMNSRLKAYYDYGLIYLFKFTYEFKRIFEMMKVSVPVSIQMVMEAGAFAFAAFMVGWIGINEIGAHQISLNVASTAYMIATGIGAASTVRSGKAFGSKNFMMIRNAAIANLMLVLFYNILTATIFLVFGNEIAMFYTDEVEIIKMASSLLVLG